MRSRIQGRNFAETLIPLDPKAFFNDTLGSEMLLANIDSLIQSQNFDEALRILEITVKGIEEGTNQLFGGKKYTDDSINEYHHFDNPLEVFLYLRLCQPAKQIKQIPENYARLYMRYGCVCMELKRYGEARTALQKALRWNPIKVSILFELAETYKIEKKLDKFREITVKCFHYAYTSQDLARCYRNLGYYYIERQDYDLAVALFNYSLFWAESPMGRNELVYIAQMTGKAIVAPSAKESQRLFETHKIPLRPDLTILNIVTGLAAGAKKEHEIDAANFFHSILDNLQPEHARFTKGNVSEGEPAKKRGRLKADKQDKGSGKITQTAVKPTTGFREYIDEISGKYNTLLSKTPADSKVIMDNLEEIVFAITVFGASFYSMDKATAKYVLDKYHALMNRLDKKDRAYDFYAAFDCYMRGRYEEYITLMGKYMKRYCAENGFFDYEWSQLNIFNVIDFINADDPKGDYKELLSGLLKIVKKLSPGSALEKQLETNLGYASRNVYREEDLLEILKVDSAWALASLQLARFYCNKDKGEGVWGKAIACYEEASGSKVVPIDYNDYFCLGYCYNAAQQTQQAIVAYEKCLAIEPNHPAANSNIGSCYEQLGEYRKALKSYEKSIEADQSDAFPYRCKFCLLSKMGENKTALAFAEANPKYFKTKHFQQAIDEMKRGKRRG